MVYPLHAQTFFFKDVLEFSYQIIIILKQKVKIV